MTFRIRNKFITLVIAIITALCMTCTIFYAYNGSLEEPHIASLVAKTPERTILILNIMSQITLFSLAELTTLAMDATRWSLACSTTGASSLAFLALSRATSFLGVLYLSFGTGEIGAKLERNGHRVWGSQRITLTFIRALLGVVLLSDVSFKSTYREVQQFQIIQSGLTSMNTSLVNDPQFQFFATGNFWWHFPSMMSYGLGVEPLNCSGPTCKSFWFPGPISLIEFPPDATPMSPTDSPHATTFVEKNSPGYQIEFQSVDLAEDVITLADCRVFGIPIIALELCLKKDNDSNIVASWTPCPLDVAEQTSCLNTTDWRVNTGTYTKMTVSKRHGSTIFDRSNLTLIDVIDLSEPLQVIYEPEELFAFYEFVFAIDLNSTDFFLSTPYSFLLTISSYLQGSKNQIQPLGGSPQIRLQEFLATPTVIYNDAWLGLTVSDPDMGKSLALAIASYRLLISPVTLYSFMVGGVISLLWCLIVLALSLGRTIPETSLFPEIDFASKLSGDLISSSNSLQDILPTLSLANTCQIRRALAHSKFRVQLSSANPELGRAKSIAVVQCEVVTEGRMDRTETTTEL